MRPSRTRAVDCAVPLARVVCPRESGSMSSRPAAAPSTFASDEVRVLVTGLDPTAASVALALADAGVCVPNVNDRTRVSMHDAMGCDCLAAGEAVMGWTPGTGGRSAGSRHGMQSDGMGWGAK